MTRIEIIERSMRCFRLGLIGLLPVIGIPMAATALAQGRRVKFDQGAMWNPAERYLIWASRCVLIAIFLNGIIALFICIAAFLPGPP